MQESRIFLSSHNECLGVQYPEYDQSKHFVRYKHVIFYPSQSYDVCGIPFTLNKLFSTPEISDNNVKTYAQFIKPKLGFQEVVATHEINRSWCVATPTNVRSAIELANWWCPEGRLQDAPSDRSILQLRESQIKTTNLRLKPISSRNFLVTTLSTTNELIPNGQSTGGITNGFDNIPSDYTIDRKDRISGGMPNGCLQKSWMTQT